MTKIIIMYRTALFAEIKRDAQSHYFNRSGCNDLINNFNKGNHITDDDNEENAYSIL